MGVACGEGMSGENRMGAVREIQEKPDSVSQVIPGKGQKKGGIGEKRGSIRMKGGNKQTVFKVGSWDLQRF